MEFLIVSHLRNGSMEIDGKIIYVRVSTISFFRGTQIKTIIWLERCYKKRKSFKNLLISFHRYFINPFTGIINGTSDWNVGSSMF